MLGLLSFMQCDDQTYGSVKVSDDERRRLAANSEAFNEANPIFKENFPDDIMVSLKASLIKNKLVKQRTREIQEKREQERPTETCLMGFFKAPMGKDSVKPMTVLHTLSFLRYKAWVNQF